jgi:hypothetical protein
LVLKQRKKFQKLSQQVKLCFVQALHDSNDRNPITSNHNSMVCKQLRVMKLYWIRVDPELVDLKTKMENPGKEEYKWVTVEC